MASRFRSNLFTKLAQAGQLTSGTGGILTNRISNDGRKRFDDLLNGMVQQNRESNHEKRESFTVKKERFDLPNVVSQTEEGKVNAQVVDALNSMDNDEDSGHLYPESRAQHQANHRMTPFEEHEDIILIIILLITIIVSIIFVKLICIQKSINTLIESELDS